SVAAMPLGPSRTSSRKIARRCGCASAARAVTACLSSIPLCYNNYCSLQSMNRTEFPRLSPQADWRGARHQGALPRLGRARPAEAHRGDPRRALHRGLRALRLPHDAGGAGAGRRMSATMAEPQVHLAALDRTLIDPRGYLRGAFLALAVAVDEVARPAAQ